MTDPRSRDSAATARSIVEAAKLLIAREGFQALGVNALARAAGCDKQLVYRYFGGLDGVVDAVGVDLADWSKAKLQPLLALGAPQTYGEMVERLGLGLLQAFRDDPLMRQIKAAEFAAPSPQLARIAGARGASLQRWITEAKGDLAPPPGVDAPAANAMIIASIEAFVVAAAASNTVYGLSVASEDGWERIRQALKTLVRGVYGALERP